MADLPLPMQIGTYTLTRVDAAGTYLLGGRGDYKFEPYTLTGRRNGRGLQVATGYAKIVWKWSTLPWIDWQFLAGVLLLEQPSRRFTFARFYNQFNSLQTFSHCIVHTPTYEGQYGGDFLNVVLNIDRIMV